MSRRTSVLLIGAGAAAVLVALVLLWQSTRSHAVPLPPSTEPAAPPPIARAPEAAPAMPTPSQTAARPAKPNASALAPAPTRPAPAPVEPEGSAKDDGVNLHFGADQLYPLAQTVEPLVRECVNKAAVTGAKPTGTAWLTYTVVQKGDKFVIEETGFDPAKTTLKGDGLLECLHQTAKAMKFQGLPRDAPELWAARSVTLEDGKIVEYTHAWFSYNPPKPPK